MHLTTPLPEAGRIYKMYAKRLEKLGITTFNDFLFHIPSRYDDFSLIAKIANVQPGEVVTIQGEVMEMKNEFTRKYKKLQKAKVSDGTGIIDVLWFNQMYLTNMIHVGNKISLSGRIEENGRTKVLISPTHEVVDDFSKTIHTGRLVPIYPETAGISSKWLRKQVFQLLQENKNELTEYVPESTVKKLDLDGYDTALSQIHFPKSLESAQKAKERLAFDEVFLLQLAAKQRKAQWREKATGNAFSVQLFAKQVENFFAKLPFTLTDAQKRAIEEIFADVSKEKPMNRLLEGDVGSGKTVVAAAAIYLAFLNGFQSIFMAPTQILAQQHFVTVSKLLTPLNLTVGLQTGSRKTEGKCDVLVGTHAVLSEKIELARLGLVIIDEQQRFGVEQRAVIKQKGKNPHLLTMTATPIPRTVALALYGDLDLSLLDEMPVGRKPVKTWLVPKQKRENAEKWIAEHVKNGEQVFIVCPFIEESENMTTVKAAKTEFERLQKVFPQYKLVVLHGKLKAKEKDAILQDFRDKKYDMLVATPIVEVGIDIPGATVIVVEAADRFGLSQLHQLRGRVGRNDKQSYCLLFTETNAEQTTKRLKAMETIQNGATLAELDLQMRGAGELYGTLQHGRRWLKIASFSDFTLIETAKNEANSIFPGLINYPLLQEKVQRVNIQEVNPD